MKNKILFFCQILFTIISVTIVTIFASQAGSSEDPLVAKSYVDSKIEEVLKEINSTNQNNIPIESSQKYIPVYLEKGKTILGEEGTEIILRSGKATSVITGVDGLTNITSGENIENGKNIELNNLIIVPRSDGRGIKANENCWLLVKGNYNIN